ncbi:LuxR C-terminal-related transcriptional regulator [Streptomyces sp. PSRA5]|uniref:helix-turn-helix transcriptional regulator n=1 Tax=Streptomyces panacea TaxID=3035064 RepID=UPI00339C909C
MAEAALGRDALRAIGRDGLVLPRAPYPGQKWKPTTPAETHLVAEARRLDGHRRKLLAEIARMQLAANRDRAARRGGRRPVAPVFVEPLTERDVEVLAAAAAGESETETADRLGLTTSGVKSRRTTARLRLGAPTFARALVIATAAGVISPAGGVQ